MMKFSTRMAKLFLFALILGGMYWILESAISAYVFHKSEFVALLFQPATDGIWQRILVFGLLICFALIVDLLAKHINFTNIRETTTEQESQEVTQSFNQTVIDGVSLPIMAIGLDYQVKLMNNAARAFSSTDIKLPKTLKCYQVSHQRETPCNGIEHPCPLDLVHNSDRPITLVHQHTQANGELRLVEVTASPLRKTDGSIHGIIESIYDITERQKAEEAKAQYAGRLRALATQLTRVADVERARLARELHDQVGQNLTALGINLNIIRSYFPEDVSTQALYHINDSQSLIEQTTERIRDLMADLRPPLLDEYGLLAALRWYGEQFSRRTHIAITVESNDPTNRLPVGVENAIFSIAQEALTNIAKHAQAKSARVAVEVEDKRVRLVVSDDGIGFQPSHRAKSDEDKGWGFVTMAERAESVGGSIYINSVPHLGTEVIVELPR